MPYFNLRYIFLLIFWMSTIFIIAQSDQTENLFITPTASNFTYPQSLFVDSYNGNIWVTDFDNNRVMRFDVSTLTSLDEIHSSNSPLDFSLDQNYPNPFNPITNISFSVTFIGITKLEVYNLLGQKVAVLFDEIATANTIYSIKFNAENYSSGIYIYSLRTKTGIESKKMCLIK